MIPLKSESDLAALRESGIILAGILRQMEKEIRPGISTKEIDLIAEELVRREKVLPAFKGYRGYPATICVSVNEEIVHGIPSQRCLVEGDIVSIDLGIKHNGFFSDAAYTLPVGRISEEKQKLITVTRQALEAGIAGAREGNHLYDISAQIQRVVEQNGLSVVRQFVGHGIGVNLHEEPEIPNFGKPHQGAALQKGMVLAIEPMVNCGGWECEVLDDGWTAVTRDRLPSAHFEHTVAITGRGPEILTA